MCSLGLSLTPGDFKRVVVFPKGAAIGIANLLLISPLLAFAVAEGFGLAPTLAVGLVLLGASPGGTTANMLVHLARGDTALSITLTALSSLAAVVTVPLYLELSTEHFGSGVGTDVSMAGVVARVFLITVVPLAIGMYIRHRSPERVIAMEARVRRIALGVFLLVVIAAVASEWELVTENFADVAAAALALNLAAMSVSFTLSVMGRLDSRQSTAIAIELGVHNATLAIAVAATLSTRLAIPAAVYSAFMFLTAGLFARAMYRRNAGLAPADRAASPEPPAAPRAAGRSRPRGARSP
jgi:BASS family bile acid:Na+ symporter